MKTKRLLTTLTLVLVFTLANTNLASAQSSNTNQSPGTCGSCQNSDPSVTTTSNSNGQGNSNPTQQSTKNQAIETNLEIKTENTYQAQDMEQIKNTLQIREQEMIQTINQQTDQQLKTLLQNNVGTALALQSFASSEDLLGEDYTNISETVEELKTDLYNTISLQDTLDNENKVKLFFVGSNKDEVEKLQNLSYNFTNNINKLNNQLNNCQDCNSEIKTYLDQQITILEDHNQQISTYIQEKININGLFGWLINLFR